MLDVDNVLGDFHQAAADAMTHLFGRKVTQQDLPCWEVTEKLSDPKERSLIWKTMRGRGFCSNIPVVAGAQAAVQKLQSLADVYFVTSPMVGSVGWVHERTGWLRKHFGVSLDHVVFTRAKHVVLGDMLLDDHPDNLEKWAEAHPTGLAMLWERHYNKDAGFRKARQWDDVIDVVQKL